MKTEAELEGTGWKLGTLLASAIPSQGRGADFQRRKRGTPSTSGGS